MAKPRVTLNSRGITDILTSLGMMRAVEAKTEQVARRVKAQGIKVGAFKGGEGEIDLPVQSSMTTTDRAHGRVTLAHPAGQAVQAKHGSLTKAALESGLEVTVE